MADKKQEELRKKLEALSQDSPSKIEDAPEPEVTPEIVPKVEPKPEVPAIMETATTLMNQLSPDEIGMLKKMISGDVPQEVEVSQPEPKPEPTPEPLPEPEPVPEPTPVPSNEENAERLAQIESEINRLQNAGVFRVELIYQLLSMNSSLDRIAKALEKE